MATMDGLLCSKWSPAENQLIAEINCGWQHHLMITPCMGVCCNRGSQMSDLGSDSVCNTGSACVGAWLLFFQ